MAEAKKCDRCGDFYEPHKGLRLVNGGNVYNQVYFRHDFSQCSKHFDLCLPCMEKLAAFMRNEEEES